MNMISGIVVKYFWVISNFNLGKNIAFIFGDLFYLDTFEKMMKNAKH